jgi:hypothetical protein
MASELDSESPSDGEPDSNLEHGSSEAQPKVSLLSPKRQVGIITLSSVVDLGFIWAVARHYHRYLNFPHDFYAWDWISVIVAAVWVWVATSIIDDWLPILRSSTDSTLGRLMGNLRGWLESDRILGPSVWVLSAVQLFLLGYLVMRTGGFDRSPYIAIFTTFIALAPNASHGLFSIPSMYLGAVGYLLILANTHWFLDRQAIHCIGGGTMNCSLPTSIYVSVTLGTITIAMGLAFSVRYRQLRHSPGST